MSDHDNMRQFARGLFTEPAAAEDEPRRPRRNFVPREGQPVTSRGFTAEMEQRDFIRDLFDAYHVPERPPEPPEIPHHTDYL